MFTDNFPEDKKHQREPPAKKEYWKVIAKHPKHLQNKQIVRLASANQVSIALQDVFNEKVAFQKWYKLSMKLIRIEENIFENGTLKNVNRMHSF
ncbi:hypothetical protein AVEN_130758-1 [Araneus ventricosus]|uniref:Uncharacterized protein n=1 Tax=Araneus ventricosus TaxID=182803 RepID=A0A4Y2GGX2_ARAVE|nr:hypothetical protein AVEN_130758-1 [Araneus ventricosus]